MEDLQQRIDEQQERENYESWLDFLRNECTDDIFIPPVRNPAPPKITWPEVSVNQAIKDVTAMLLQEFKGCSDVLTRGGSSRMNVRCNYGTGILPSLFGCELFMMDETLNELPAAKPLGSSERVKAVLEKGIPDVRKGLGGKVFQSAERFLEAFEKYPVLKRNVALYHPDLQGPIDAAEVIWGSEIFYAFYDEPDMVRDLLSLITDTYIAFMRQWYALVGQAGEYSVHWGILYRGVLMLRDDSLVNLSPETYTKLIRPCDQKLFDEFGGVGAIHFCGRGDHYIEAMSEMAGLSAIAMSQPELNDMETIYRHTVDKGIKLIHFSLEYAKKTVRPLRGQVQCFLTDRI